MSNHEKLYHQWINDAYSMELALIPVLENHAKDMEEHSLYSTRIRQHVRETERHAESLKNCIVRTGGDVSGVKAGLGKILGAIQSVSTGMFSDELIKNCLADLATENLEIASYTSLIAAAESEGDTETASTCRTILEDEIRMADWVKSQIPMITNHVLQKS